ncbi:MAG TPA: 3-methyladenine DNA glycosylase [Gemmataceae bacterium]|nr:3-methyladenine DNA glycosylase [Gemmataceae bacterium]
MFDRSLSPDEWRTRREAYRARVRPQAEDRVRRVSRQRKHPVHDFLFEYYAYRPSYLMRWSPGVGVRLEAAVESDLDWRPWFRPCDGGWVLPAADFSRRRLPFLRWAIEYLETTGEREPSFGCFGLHEWAMVYREEQVRHDRIPLRLSRDETDDVVEAAALRCTHYDAFRFFTPPARPRNRVELSREATPAHDQPGCLHVTMDLYKWAFVIAPYSSAEVVADAFELAVATRELDMRASPYDLAGMGFPPVRIETREGREEYVEAQRLLYGRAQPVRRAVLAEYRRLLELVTS